MTEILAEGHPFVVHFAVALGMTSVLFDILSLLRRGERLEATGFSLALLALPFLVAAVLTGNLAQQSLHDPALTPFVDDHRGWANAAMWLFSAATISRVSLMLKRRFDSWRKAVFLATALLAAMLIFVAAMKGGEIFHGRDNRPVQHDPGNGDGRN